MVRFVIAESDNLSLNSICVTLSSCVLVFFTCKIEMLVLFFFIICVKIKFIDIRDMFRTEPGGE